MEKAIEKSLHNVVGNGGEEDDCTVTIEEVDELSSLVEGDQIAVKGGASSSCCSTVYYHHGIFMGHDKVVDFCQEPGKPKETARVRKVDISKFTAKDLSKLVKIKYSKEYFTGTDVADRAKNQFESQTWGKFSLVTSNCEHFACWCKTGRKESTQVNEVLKNFKFKTVRIIASSSGGSLAITVGCLFLKTTLRLIKLTTGMDWECIASD